MLCCYKQLERPPGLPVLHGITASLSRYPRPVTASCFFLGPVCVTQCRLLALARSVQSSLCVYLSARCGAAAGASRCIPWACACCSERSAHHERGLSHRSAPRSVYLHLPAVSLPARCGPAACSPLRGSVCHSCYAGVFSHRAARGPSGAPGAVACWVSAVSGSFSHTRESNGV